MGRQARTRPHQDFDVVAQAVGPRGRRRAPRLRRGLVRRDDVLLRQLLAAHRPAAARRARPRAPARAGPPAGDPARPVDEQPPADRPAERAGVRGARRPRKARRVHHRRRLRLDHAARSDLARRDRARRIRTAPAERRSPRGARSRASDHVVRLERGAKRNRSADARRAGARVDQPRRTREAPAGGPRRHPAPHGPGRAVDRGSPLLRASRHRSDRHGRGGLLLRHGPTQPHGRRQHHHPAAGAQRLPAEVRRHDARNARASVPRAARCSRSSSRSS